MCHTCKYSRGDNNTPSMSQNVFQPCPKRASNVPKTGFPKRFPIISQTALGLSQRCPKTIPKPMFWEHSHIAALMESFGNPKKCWKISQNVSQTCPKQVPNSSLTCPKIYHYKWPSQNNFLKQVPNSPKYIPYLAQSMFQNLILGCLWDTFRSTCDMTSDCHDRRIA